MTRALIGCCLVLLVHVPSLARAFSDPATFADQADQGGGGGRWFTGSPLDSYTCAVCHHGGHNPELVIYGLPLAGYVPGTSYEVTITWPSDKENVALEAEFTDGRGQPTGVLRLPPQSELKPAELCLPVIAGIPAGMLNPVGKRMLISMSDCGAQQLRLLFTAPARDLGTLRFSGSVVTSNAQGDVGGDGVTDFARVLPSPSSREPVATRIEAGCNAAGHAGTNADAAIAGLALVWLACKRRRAHR